MNRHHFLKSAAIAAAAILVPCARPAIGVDVAAGVDQTAVIFLPRMDDAAAEQYRLAMERYLACQGMSIKTLSLEASPCS